MSVIRNLIRDYGDFQIHIPLWEISDNGVTALRGPSGSGKTSVIRLLLGLDEAPQLSWTWANGEDLAQLPVTKRNLGVVFQNYELFPHMTSLENILFAARARKITDSDTQERLKRLSHMLHLDKFLNRKTSLLSGGERQRVALARALIGRPRFLFLDEPFSALDANLRAEARALVKNLITELSIPTLLVSHDEEDVRALAHTVAEIRDGHLLERMPPAGIAKA